MDTPPIDMTGTALWGQAPVRKDDSGNTGWDSASVEPRMPRQRRKRYFENPVSQKIFKASLVDMQNFIARKKQISEPEDKIPLATLVSEKEKVLHSKADNHYEELFYWCQSITELYPFTKESDDAWIIMIEQCLDNKFGQDILPDWLVVETLLEMNGCATPYISTLLYRSLAHPKYQDAAHQLKVIEVLQPIRFS